MSEANVIEYYHSESLFVIPLVATLLVPILSESLKPLLVLCVCTCTTSGQLAGQSQLKHEIAFQQQLHLKIAKYSFLTPVALSFQVPMAHHDRVHGHMMAAASPFWWPSIMCYPTLGPPISTGHLQSSRLRPIKQQNIIIQPQFLNKLEILKSQHLNAILMSLNFSNPMKQLNIIISGHYFPGFQAQRYMFRLMTFEVLKLVNQFGLYLYLSAANRAFNSHSKLDFQSSHGSWSLSNPTQLPPGSWIS